MAWEDFANRVSDKIVDLLNAEIKANPEGNMLQLLAGQMAAIKAQLRTAEEKGLNKPQPIDDVEIAIDICLGWIAQLLDPV